MEKLNKKENIIEFKAEIDESLANAIRRYLNEIPVLAVDEVEISRNDSPLYDETVAHRIGLIPLKMDNRMGESTTSEFELKTKKEGMVHSEEMKGGKGVVYGKIPITLLNKGQELDLKAYATTGRGSQHSKYSPGIMFYRDSENPDEDNDSKNALFIRVETFGQIPVEEIFPKAIEELKKDLSEISKKIK